MRSNNLATSCLPAGKIITSHYLMREATGMMDLEDFQKAKLYFNKN